jgi:Tol biopolymer transport system component
LTGDPVSIGSGLESYGPVTAFALAGDTLVWSHGTVVPPARLIWFDRNGQRLKEIGDVRQYRQVALAPDGQRVVTDAADPRIGNSLFLFELTRPIHARLTTGDQVEYGPVWSSDSREVAFVSIGGLFRRSIDQNVRLPLLESTAVAMEDWSRDGRFVMFQPDAQSIWALPLGGDRKPVSVVHSSSMVDEPHLSFDSRWLTYSSNETGQWEVYVQPFMGPAGRVRVSTNGASQPRWRADGKELFYRALDGAMMSVDMTDPAKPGAPLKLFDLRFWGNPVEDQYDVTAALAGELVQL